MSPISLQNSQKVKTGRELQRYLKLRLPTLLCSAQGHPKIKKKKTVASGEGPLRYSRLCRQCHRDQESRVECLRHTLKTSPILQSIGPRRGSSHYPHPLQAHSPSLKGERDCNLAGLPCSFLKNPNSKPSHMIQLTILECGGSFTSWSPRRVSTSRLTLILSKGVWSLLVIYALLPGLPKKESL